MFSTRLIVLLLFGLLVPFSACSESDVEHRPSPLVHGTVSTRVVLGGATITLRDATGRRVSGKADRGGSYSIDTLGLRPPYLVKAESPDRTRTLYSTSVAPTAAGTINVTPLTDVVARALLSACATTPEQAFTASAGPCHSELAVRVVSNALGESLRFWRKRLGHTSADFRPIDGPIDAEARRLLAQLEESSKTSVLSFHDKPLHQRIEVDLSSPGTLVLRGAVVGPRGGTRSAVKTVVPVEVEAVQAVTGASAALAALVQAAEEKGWTLTASELASLLPESFRHNGLDREQFATLKATASRGTTSHCVIAAIESLDLALERAESLVVCDRTRDGVTTTDHSHYAFGRTASGWAIVGNGLAAHATLVVGVENQQGAEASESPILRVRAALEAGESTIDTVSVTSTKGVVQDLRKSESSVERVVAPEHGVSGVVTKDVFVADLAERVDRVQPGELAYAFEITPRAGLPSRHQQTARVITDETIFITNVAGSAPADARLGQPLEIGWALPVTFEVASIRVKGVASGGEPGARETCPIDTAVLPATANSATVSFPSVCRGQTIDDATLWVVVSGYWGEHTTASYSFKAPSDPALFVPQVLSLPVVRIATQNAQPVESKEEYLQGEMTIDPNGHDVPAFNGSLRIRGRGNSTWAMPKRPYRVKLDAKRGLLGMPSSKDWVLLANYADKTMLRTHAAFRLGERIGMAWTPRSAFVEVFLNGEYLGVYQLAEKIEIANDRVDIDTLDEDDVDPALISGGYLLEVDTRADGETYFTSSQGVSMVYDDPAVPSAEQRTYLENYVNAFEAALYGSDFADPDLGYAAYIDTQSFVRWYLVNELFKNNDAVMFSSCWMYKPRGEKLTMGPLWDFDLAAGNVNYNDNDLPTGWWVGKAPWFHRLLADPAFEALVIESWDELTSEEIPALLRSLRDAAQKLQQAQLNNFQRWPILATAVWPNPVATGSYAGEVNRLLSWLETRIAWMDAEYHLAP